MFLVCLVPGGVLQKVLYQEVRPGDVTVNPFHTILQKSCPFRKAFIQNDSARAFGFAMITVNSYSTNYYGD